ncbi:MAG: hypothetical protein ACTHLY_02655 [Pseudolabrys sp.]
MRRLAVTTAALAAILTAFMPTLSFAARDDRSVPMRFELFSTGTADQCKADCSRLISAYGSITADTPRDFRAFAAGKDLGGATVVLDSDGGSVLGALAFGREIRRLGLATMVGHIERPVEAADAGKSTPLRVDPHADCESMCAFVLLGGTHRHVPAEARVMVHQIWLGDRRDDPTAGTYSAEDLMLVQRDIARLAQYVVDMGVGAGILDLALRIPPWEPMRQLSTAELQRLELVTDTAPKAASVTPAAMTPTTGSPVSPATLVRDDGGNVGRAGWALLSEMQGTALTRRHPVTVEGEEIGLFDLTFACGSSVDNYIVSYSETRARRGGDPATVAEVTLGIASRTLPLTIVPRKAETDSEIETFASGIIPGELVRALAGGKPRSLVVATSMTHAKGASDAGEATSIRLGNVGFSGNFPKLAASCERVAGKAVADAGGKIGTKINPKNGALAHAEDTTPKQ